MEFRDFEIDKLRSKSYDKYKYKHFFMTKHKLLIFRKLGRPGENEVDDQTFLLQLLVFDILSHVSRFRRAAK